MKKANSIDDLPKLLIVETEKENVEYRPVIFKYENEGDENAYYAMYAKFDAQDKLDTTRVLFWVCAPTFDGATNAFVDKFNELSRFINGRTWTSCQAAKLNLLNPQFTIHYDL